MIDEQPTPEEIAALHAVLKADVAPKAGEALERAILVDFDGAARPGRLLAVRLFGHGAPRLAPAGVMAALAATGFFAGALSSSATASEDALTYFETAYETTFIGETESESWLEF